MKVSDIKTGDVYRVGGVMNPVVVTRIHRDGVSTSGLDWWKVGWDYEAGRWVKFADGRCRGSRRLDTFARAAKVIGAWPDKRTEAA